MNMSKNVNNREQCKQYENNRLIGHYQSAYKEAFYGEAIYK